MKSGKIGIGKRTVRGEVRWCVSWFVNGQRQRRFFPTRVLAEAERDSIIKQRATAGEAWLALTAPERNELLAVWQEVRDAGLTLRGVWHAYRTQPTTEQRERVRLGDAVAQFLAAKKQAGRGGNYLKQLSIHLSQFAQGRESAFVDEFTTADIEQWFMHRKEADSTRAASFARLNTFFEFARKRSLVPVNPCEAMERFRVRRTAPPILTVRQVARALVWSKRKQPRFLAWLALAIFAGIRPEELDKLDWSAVDLDGATVRIDYAVAKHGRRRIVHLRPTAVAWLRVAKRLKAELPIPHATRRRYLRALRGYLRFEQWPQDVLRHSAASYWLAEIQDAAKVALELGNSVGVLLRHYREIVHRDEAKRFWNLIPRDPSRASQSKTTSADCKRNQDHRA